MEGVGQELFNAGVLFSAVAMLGWHSIWMQCHGRELAARMTAVGSAVAAGARPLGDSGVKLKYNAGYLFGVSDEAADGVFKAIIELEFPL